MRLWSPPRRRWATIRACLASRESSCGAPLRFVSRAAPLDLAGALKLAAPIVDGDPCIVHAASGLLGEPIAPFLADVRSDSPDVVLIVHQSPAPPEGRLSAATQQMPISQSSTPPGRLWG